MKSTMQDAQLTIGSLMRHGTTVHADSEVVTATADGTRSRSYAELGRRAAQLAHGLRSPGLQATAEGCERVALAQLAHDLRRGGIDRAEDRLGTAAQPHEAPAAGSEARHQYVSLPPERSNAAPVENVMRSLARNAISSAASSVFARRPIGTRESM